MTLEEFKLKEYRTLYRELSAHKKHMTAYRATANQVTLGFLDAIEENHDRQLATFKLRIDMLKPRPKGDPTPFLTLNEIALAKTQPISQFLTVKASSKVVCLFHNDKTPSMHIYGTTYHCFTCGAHGTVIDVVMKLRNCSFSQAVKFLIGK